MGATSTPVGTPAALRARRVSSRRLGDAVRGSMMRLRPSSNVVTLTMTLARFRFAMEARISRSRSISAPLRDDSYRVVAAIQHFEDAAGDAEAALDGLIGIGVGAERDGARPVAGPGELALEQRGRVFLVEQPSLEIESGRQIKPCVTGAGIAIDASVFTASVGIDGLIEIDVR